MQDRSFPFHSPCQIGAGARQRGIALFVVIVFVMLSMLLALWASRTSIFSEMVVGNDADYQRAYEAAQALLQDAELDIRGQDAGGSPCTPNTSNDKVCRRNPSIDQIPLEGKDVGKLLAELNAANTSVNPTQCNNALCIKREGRQDFWNNADASRGTTLGQMTGPTSAGGIVGARYGMFTGAQLGTSNPILAETAVGKGGWYWIEVLPYSESSKNAGLIVDSAGVSTNNYLALNLLPNVVYRITSVANGRKPGSMVVLQQTYARQKLKD